jgi:hypothetical protein
MSDNAFYWKIATRIAESHLCTLGQTHPLARIWYEHETGWHVIIGEEPWPVHFATETEARTVAETQVRGA